MVATAVAERIPAARPASSRASSPATTTASSPRTTATARGPTSPLVPPGTTSRINPSRGGWARTVDHPDPPARPRPCPTYTASSLESPRVSSPESRWTPATPTMTDNVDGNTQGAAHPGPDLRGKRRGRRAVEPTLPTTGSGRLSTGVGRRDLRRHVGPPSAQPPRATVRRQVGLGADVRPRPGEKVVDDRRPPEVIA